MNNKTKQNKGGQLYIDIKKYFSEGNYPEQKCFFLFCSKMNALKPII